MTETKRPTVTVQRRADEGTWSPDEVIAKRLSGQPFGVRDDAIPLREPGKYALRIAHSQLHASRHYDMAHKLGYVPVVVGDLAEGVTPESLGFRVGEDGRLCRGERGDEVLYKMERAAYDAIQMKKAEANTRALRSEAAAKQDAANAAAQQHGSEAADYIAKNVTVRIQDSQRPVSG